MQETPPYGLRNRLSHCRPLHQPNLMIEITLDFEAGRIGMKEYMPRKKVKKRDNNSKRAK